jgi:hypothetical protein
VDVQVPKWLLWLRFIPVKLHIVVPIICALLGCWIGGRAIEDFWNPYVAGGFFVGIPLGVALQVLKRMASEAARKQRRQAEESGAAGRPLP